MFVQEADDVAHHLLGRPLLGGVGVTHECPVAVVGALHHVSGAVHALGAQRVVQDQVWLGEASWSALPCSRTKGGLDGVT